MLRKLLRLAATMVEGATFLRVMANDLTDLPAKVKRIQEIEARGDAITQHVIELLHDTFITPIDRDQIYTLVSRLDDILDAIEEAGVEFLVYDIERTTPECRELTGFLETATLGLREAIRASATCASATTSCSSATTSRTSRPAATWSSAPA